MRITVETRVGTPVEQVWRGWTTPEDIKRWNAASDDWHTTAASVDLEAEYAELLAGAAETVGKAREGALCRAALGRRHARG